MPDCSGRRSSILRARLPQDHRQAWHPDLIPIVQGKYDFRDTSDWVEKVSKAAGSTVPDLISWEWA